MRLSVWPNAAAYCRNAWCYQPRAYFSVRSVGLTTVRHVIVPNVLPTGIARTTSGRWPCLHNQRLWIQLRLSGGEWPWRQETCQEPSGNQAQVVRDVHGRLEPPGVIHDHLVKLSTQFIHDAEKDYEQGLPQNILTSQGNAQLTFWRSLNRSIIFIVG